MEKILQIIPAHGVQAVYIDGQGKRAGEYPVVCWSLSERDDDGVSYQVVEGMVVIEGMRWLAGVRDEDSPDSKFSHYEYTQNEA